MIVIHYATYIKKKIQFFKFPTKLWAQLVGLYNKL